MEPCALLPATWKSKVLETKGVFWPALAPSENGSENSSDLTLLQKLLLHKSCCFFLNRLAKQFLQYFLFDV